MRPMSRGSTRAASRVARRFLPSRGEEKKRPSSGGGGGLSTGNRDGSGDRGSRKGGRSGETALGVQHRPAPGDDGRRAFDVCSTLARGMGAALGESRPALGRRLADVYSQSKARASRGRLPRRRRVQARDSRDFAENSNRLTPSSEVA